MIKHLIKSIIFDNVALTVCATICLVLSIFVILYEVSFSYKVTTYNFDSTYFVETDEMSFSEAKHKTEEVGMKNFTEVMFIVGNGIVFSKSNKDVIKGRLPIKEGEVIASYLLKCDIGTTVHYGEKEYKVSGITSSEDYDILIDYDLNDCSIYNVSGILLVASVKVARDEVIKKLKEVFPRDSISVPKKVGVKEALTTTPIFILSIVVILLSVCTYSFCINYLLQKTIKPMTVYLFLGFSSESIIIRLLSFVLAIITCCFVACSGIYAIAEQVVSQNSVAFMPNVKLMLGDYLLIYAIIIIASLIMVLPAIISISKKSVRYKYV